MGNLALSNSFFESPTYWYCSPRGGGFGRGCSMQSTFTVFTSFSQSCMVEFEGAGVTEIFQICMRIPNRHFPTWKIKVLPPVTFPTAPHLFPNPERVQPPDPTDRSRQRPRDQLFILYVGVCIP
jgi:hypothetical protein